MAETSGLWTTAGAPAGHQVVSYTQALASTMLEVAAACSGFEGVAPGYLNELAPSSTGINNVRIATGGAMVDGKYYKNSANVDLNIPDAGAGETRIDRVVLVATWADFDCVLEVLPGTSHASPTPPTLADAGYDVSGTAYAIYICQVLVTQAGAITITDERTWAIVDTDGSTLEDSSGALQVKDGGITAAKIANRTRRFFVPAVQMIDQDTSTDLFRLDYAGWKADDSDHSIAFGEFWVPEDFVSGMTVKAVYQPNASGNIYSLNYARYGASGQAYSTHTNDDGGPGVVAVTDAVLNIQQTITLTNAALNDVVTLNWDRDAASGSDTLAGWVYFKGWLVEYTADS